VVVTDAEFVGELLQAVEAARAEDDVRAVLHKVACGFGTEAGGGAGDDDGFVGDVFHGGFLGVCGLGHAVWAVRTGLFSPAAVQGVLPGAT